MTATKITYNKNGVIRLAIIDPAGDTNWQDDTFTMALRLGGLDVPLGASAGPPATVTITDINAAPVVKFSPASIKLTERSQTTATVTVGAGDTNDIPGDVSMITTQLRLMVSHPDIVMTGITGSECPPVPAGGIVMAINGPSRRQSVVSHG